MIEEVANGFRLVSEVKGVGKIVECHKDFYESMVDFGCNGVEYITPRDALVARFRSTGLTTHLSAGFVCAPKEPPILMYRSRFFEWPELAREAVEFNRKGEFYFKLGRGPDRGNHPGRIVDIYDLALEQAKEDAGKKPGLRRAIVLPSGEGFQTNYTENPEVLEFLIGGRKLAGKYLHKSRGWGVGITPPPKDKVDATKGIILAQAFICGASIDYSDNLHDWKYHPNAGVVRFTPKTCASIR